MDVTSKVIIDTDKIIIDSLWIDTDCKPYIDCDIVADVERDILSIPSVFEIKYYSRLQFQTDCYLYQLENICKQVNSVLYKYDLLNN